MKLLIFLRLSDLGKEVKSQEEFWGELKPETRQHLKMLIEGILIEEQTRTLAAPRCEISNQFLKELIKFKELIKS